MPAFSDPDVLHLARTIAMDERRGDEFALGFPQSLPNGFKLMTRHQRDAIAQTQAMFPPNIRGTVMNPTEHVVVFHEHPFTGKLMPVGRSSGSESGVGMPADVVCPTARIMVHSHPFTGVHNHDFPSMADQLTARRIPNVEHMVQTPAASAGKPNKFLIYTGAYPPRFHTLVENPDNLPVSPHSPDGEVEPPFRKHPFK
jgi:hypothetical protein